MRSRRTIEIRMPVRALLNTAILSAGLALSAPVQAAVADERLLQPTPLILKDGRIANVSVHVLSFAPGQSVLGPANAQRLDGLSAQLATDCFLTAQVIGHVGSAEVGNDTLGAHRLARARADAVQASLIADGLPAKAIASVWDWQFMVREPRATLWVFRLTPGEDCEGKPLDRPAPPWSLAPSRRRQRSLPASLSRSRRRSARRTPSRHSPGPGPEPAVPAEAGRPRRRPRRPGGRGATARCHGPAGPAGRPKRPAAVAGPPAGTGEADAPRRRVAGPAEPAGAPSVTQALPAVSPKPVAAAARPSDGPARPPASRPPSPPRSPSSEPAARKVPEVVAALPEPPAEPAAEPVAAGAAGAEELVIVFPTNSSYFPPGTGTQLQALLSQLARGQHYQVILQASVSGSQKVVGAESPEEAAKYNQWLAERRVDRVRSWLDQNVADDVLVVKPEYRPNDESRQLVVRLVPAA